MSESIDRFPRELFDHGTIMFRERQLAPWRMTPDCRAALADAFETHRLSVPGPMIAFDSAMAFSAAEVVRQAAWAVVNREDRAEQMAARVALSRYPLSASQHLSADLMLRYLPGILSRARAINVQDPLVEILITMLRRCPLTGVLASVDEAPFVPLEFGGHRGLCMLYAERLVRNDRPAWRPPNTGLAGHCYQLATSVPPPSQIRASQHR